jgi:chitinase
MNVRTWARAACLSVALASAAVVAVPQLASADTHPAHYASPYLQLSDETVGDMAADLAATGTKFFTLAFLTPSSGCTQIWEASGQGVGAYKTQIQSLKNAGGDVAVSFGGAAGGEVAITCTNVTSLQAAYANVVNTYGITHLDFDIEGDTLNNSAANARRNTALAALQKANPSVVVDYTLAVGPDGLPGQQIQLLKDAKAAGVNVNVVNLMTMDFGDGENALNDAKSGANAAHSQIAGIYTGLTSAQLWNKIGLTPIAGQNDDNEFFSQSDATNLETFAATNGVQKLAFWEVDYYDKPTGYAYSRIFNKITGGTSTTPPTTPPTTTAGSITGIGGKCVDVAAASSADGTAVQIYTCNGTTAQQWAVGSGTIKALGKCLDVTAASTANGAKVQLYTCNGTGAQAWTYNASTHDIVNTAANKCLDATDQSSADGTRLQIWTCTGTSNQKWTVNS